MTSKPFATLNAIRTLPAEYRVKQDDGIEWIMQTLKRSDRDVSRTLGLYERLRANDNIAFRNSVLSDYTHLNFDDMKLFKASERDDGSRTEWWAPPLQDRMALFVEAADDMAQKAFDIDENPPSYIVDISCTGYRAPYPLQSLLLARNWERSTKLLKIGHMGCYASVPGVNLGAQLLSESHTKVSLLSTELCTLHLDPFAKDPDQIVSNILFADGAARMDLALPGEHKGLELYAHYEAIVPDSTQYMSWDLRDGRFHMTLSRKVVSQLAQVIGSHLNAFLAQEGLAYESVSRFAIHPGGPRIVETIQDELALNESAVMHSKDILKNFGNMSSATLPHVWKSMMDDDDVKAGEWIVSMAFGPGLTLTMNLLRKV